MAVFVLVHGASHGGWCWERVVPLLEARGHRVYAPDLPGMGDDKTPHEQLTSETWTSFLVNLVRSAAEPVVLVGHSRGGVQISNVAEVVPQLVRKLVYLSGFVPLDGSDNMSLAMQFCGPDLMQAAAQMQETQEWTVDLARQVFYNTTEEAWVVRAGGLLGPEPMAAMLSPNGLSEDRFGTVSKVYIECLEDRAIPVASQRRMQEHAVFERVWQLPTDHSPFYSAAELLADTLCEAAGGQE